MIYDKKTVERKAKVTIERVCGYTSDSLYCSDKPDLQDIKNSYGIEVVEDCYQKEKRAERFVTGVFHKSIDEVDPRGVKRLMRLGGSITQVDGKVTAASLGPITPNTPEHLIETIQGKIDKLNIA